MEDMRSPECTCENKLEWCEYCWAQIKRQPQHTIIFNRIGRESPVFISMDALSHITRVGYCERRDRGFGAREDND